MESVAHSDLYKWQRITSKVKRPARIKNESVTDDIEQWIKKVENASDFAAAQAFGKARVGKSTKASILQTVDQLHDHDAAYEEAQELLNDWVKDQLTVLDDHTTEAAIWSDEESVNDSKFEPSIQNIIQQTDAGAISMEEYDRLMNLESYNEDLATENILEELRRKEVVKPEFLRDLGDIGGHPTFTQPKQDPAVKMQIRQNQVKETREKRRLEFLKKKEEEASRKEKASIAKQKAAEERRKAALKAKQDEMEIQKEMARIKKELQEERKAQLRKQEEERELERRIAQVAKEQAKQSREQQPAPSLAASDSLAQDNERKKKMAKAIETAEARFVSYNLKLVKRCFNSWFDVVMERRVQLGKARAVEDWKCLFRSWNAWRHFTRERALERMKLQHENSLLEDHRKLHQSSAHYERHLLQKYLMQWLIWVAQQKKARELTSDQLNVRQKMSAFLAAGKCLAEEKVKSEPKNGVMERISESKITEMFTYARKQATRRPQSSKGRQQPTEPWQVTRKHLKLSGRQIADLTDTPLAEDPQTDAFEEAVSQTASSSSSAKVPKSFQNRFQAQQKILQEQQKAIKEQKQMIEELKFKQDRSLLEEQVKQQQVIQQQLEKLTKLTMQDKKLNSVVPPTPTSSNETSQAAEAPLSSRSHISSVSKVSAASTAFSQKMAERAEERAKAKKEREERKRALEEQRVAELLAKEEEIRKQEAEEKKQRIEIFREKKRQEKSRELELQQLKEKALANQRKADDHSQLRVLKFYGFNQLKQHYFHMKELREKAALFCTHSLQNQCFQLWRSRYEEIMASRNERADRMYRKHLVRRYFRSWTQWRLQSNILTSKAERYYNSRLISEVFRSWLDFTTREKISFWEKERRARQHDMRRLITWAFSTWKNLPEERRKEVEKEKRREEMRKRVASLIPDFGS